MPPPITTIAAQPAAANPTATASWSPSSTDGTGCSGSCGFFTPTGMKYFVSADYANTNWHGQNGCVINSIDAHTKKGSSYHISQDNQGVVPANGDSFDSLKFSATCPDGTTEASAPSETTPATDPPASQQPTPTPSQVKRTATSARAPVGTAPTTSAPPTTTTTAKPVAVVLATTTTTALPTTTTTARRLSSTLAATSASSGHSLVWLWVLVVAVLAIAVAMVLYWVKRRAV